MFRYSESSQRKIVTCAVDLHHLFYAVLKHFDHTIVWGHRSKEQQNTLYDGGFSKLRFPMSEHNAWPSRAVDAVPYPGGYSNPQEMRYFAGFVMGMAASMDIRLRWGGDWDMDTDLDDQKFNDLGHFELRG